MGCCCSCCEEQDVFNLYDDAREGERGAGYMYKHGKKHSTWNKRFFVLKDCSLYYYTDESRGKVRGVIRLFNCTTKTRTDKENKRKYYFDIVHGSSQNVREFYVSTANRRDLWILAIGEEIDAARQSGGKEGFLLKKGGRGRKKWQQRWCVLLYGKFCWFEGPSDTEPKGEMDLSQGGQVRRLDEKDKRHTFEISVSNRVGSTRNARVFSAETGMDCKKWIDTVQLAIDVASGRAPSDALVASGDGPEMLGADTVGAGESKGGEPESKDTDDETLLSPNRQRSTESPGSKSWRRVFRKSGDEERETEMRNMSSDAADRDSDDDGGTGRDDPRSESRPARAAAAAAAAGNASRSDGRPVKSGLMYKKSPKRLVGWQPRYFVLQADGNIGYYKTQAKAASDAFSTGVILLSKVSDGYPIHSLNTPGGIELKTPERLYELKCDSELEADEWIQAILEAKRRHLGKR